MGVKLKHDGVVGWLTLVVALVLELDRVVGWAKVNCNPADGALLEVEVSVWEAEVKAAGWEKLKPDIAGLALENKPEEAVVVD